MDIRKYIYSHCIEPQRISIFDAYTQSYVVREVPCGKCLHCRNNHTNEWVTRLYAQSNYSDYVYYITLDYAPFDLRNIAARKLAAETAACYHNLNITRRYGMHPLLLQKNHLQDFIKRFRKNTNKKIQYFACGEYGTHAGGTGYGRPHFHIIVFSNTAICPKEFEDAWCLHGYKIGRVDFHDLRANGSFDEICTNKRTNKLNKYNSKFVFKYVCKYLQKGSFDFESLATIEYHRTYFESLQEEFTKTDTLFPETRRITDERTLKDNWNQYVKDYSPFVVCSKRPAIGLQYFEENAERFSKQDFRLFGLSEECVTFPRYWVRKTKECLCSFSAIGSESGSVSSNSRIGTILETLRYLFDSRTDISLLGSYPEERWHTRKFQKSVLGTNNSLHMYDNEEKVFYQFNGYSYTLWKKVRKLGYVRICEMDISDVLYKVVPKWQELYCTCLTPAHYMRILSETDLQDSIRVIYGYNEDKFRNDVYATYQSELNARYKTKLLTQNSKLTL